MGACEEYELLLSAWLDGELTEPENQDLQAHLARCPRCQALAEELRLTHEAFACLDDLAAPPDFAQGVMARIRAQEEPVIEQEEKPKVISLFRRPQVRALASLAACAAICIGVYQAGLFRPDARDTAYYSASVAAASAGAQGEAASAGSADSLEKPQDVETAQAGQTQVQQEAPEIQERGVETRDETDSSQSGQTAAAGTQKEGVPQTEQQPERSVASEGAQNAVQEPQAGNAETPETPGTTQEVTGAQVGVTSAQVESGAEDQEPQASEPQGDGGQPQEGTASDAPPQEWEETGNPAQEPQEDGGQNAMLGTTASQIYELDGRKAAAVLTLAALPQGAEDVLGEDVQWQAGTDGDWCLITGAQMEDLMALAQEQGQDLTGAATNPIKEDEWCALVLARDETVQETPEEPD